jgi:RTX calcium-binding nonapeptide repeat (4 copies)
MSAAFSGRSQAATAIALGVLAVALLAAAAPSEGRGTLRCTYVEAGDPGPAGNVLKVSDRTNGVTHLYRDGDAVVVFSNFDNEPTECAGAQATVFNLDRIEFTAGGSAPFINNLGDGPLAPGATPEKSGPEIEITIVEGRLGSVLNVLGESAAAGQIGPQGVAVNLNVQADGNARDVDVALATGDPRQVALKLEGTRGPDSLSVIGEPEFTGPFPGDDISLAGNRGDDILIGGPHRDGLSGGVGNDTLRGGRGRDRLTVGPGRDLARAGRGRDLIINVSDVGGLPEDTGPDRVDAGPGDDQVDVEQLLGGDRVDCGPGSHDSAFVDRGDRAAGCEQVSSARSKLDLP